MKFCKARNNGEWVKYIEHGFITNASVHALPYALGVHVNKHRLLLGHMFVSRIVGQQTLTEGKAEACPTNQNELLARHPPKKEIIISDKKATVCYVLQVNEPQHSLSS
jgi:hypothetical protein